MVKRFNVKLLLLFFLLFLIIVIINVSFDFDKVSNVNFDDITSNRREFIFVRGLSMGSYVSSYDESTNTFYFSSDVLVSNKVKAHSPYKAKIVFSYVNDKTYDILIYSNELYQKSRVVLLDMPLISITTNYSIPSYLSFINIPSIDLSVDDFADEDSDMLVNISDYSHSQNVFSTGSMHVRGSTSKEFDKKNYKLNLSSKYSLLGMERDDDWILTSLYSDKSKVREKLSNDLWNQINDNQGINNDIHSEYVEVFLDNKYCGLYLLEEKIDKKITKVTDSGLILKSKIHISNENIYDFMMNNYDGYSYPKDSYIGNFEVKYSTPSSIKRFLDIYGRFYREDRSYNSINDIYDIDNYINYKVFLAFIYGVDNTSKNFYLSLTDSNSKLLITPWDMDLTFGNIFYAPSLLKSKFVFDNDINWMNDNIVNGSLQVNDLVRNRYFELRKNVLTYDNIINMLDSYSDVIYYSGSVNRDSNLWYDYNYLYEVSLVRYWINNRIEFLDSYFSSI